jgi:hypothetical protein
MRPSDVQVLPAAVESPAQRSEDEAILSEILTLRKIVFQRPEDEAILVRSLPFARS